MAFGGGKTPVPPPDRGSQEASALADKLRKRSAEALDENATRAGTILGGSSSRQTQTSSTSRKTLLGN